MNKYKKAFACIVLATLFQGCATSPSEKNEEIALLATADYGPQPEQYQDVVKNYFTSKLKDPYSAQYRFTPPYKAYLRAAPISGGKPVKFGYIVEVDVNAKNSYGGYVGEKHHKIFIRNNIATQEVVSNPWFKEPWYQ